MWYRGVLRVCAFNLVREGKQRRALSDSEWVTALKKLLLYCVPKQDTLH
jgi:hypothetical protein